MLHSLVEKMYCFCTFIYIFIVFLERMWRRKEELALTFFLVFGLMETMIQNPWAIPRGISLIGACIQQVAEVGLQKGN